MYVLSNYTQNDLFLGLSWILTSLFKVMSFLMGFAVLIDGGLGNNTLSGLAAFSDLMSKTHHPEYVFEHGVEIVCDFIEVSRSASATLNSFNLLILGTLSSLRSKGHAVLLVSYTRSFLSTETLKSNSSQLSVESKFFILGCFRTVDCLSLFLAQCEVHHHKLWLLQLLFLQSLWT